ncbi:hypothetical protein BB561_000971 [Smittium simulii]|uniref:Uncharacterized protein n=1 Tax=Smittium simulii TaxID=133385 RepID=A0A2T9YWV1_9FUNG|nr:hypothetical protein BB561_000971 [Smittium simulii]
MKPTLTIATFTAFLLSLSVIEGELLCGKGNQRSQLESALRQANAAQIRCNPGYLGLDCNVPAPHVVAEISCNLKGKPGKSQGGIFLYQDPQNTGKYCSKQQQPEYEAPAPAPGGLRASCPLIVDIQKCMNKCVDDALA